MDIKRAIESQYLASLEMLAAAIRAADDAIWNDGAFDKCYWHIVYHTQFFTDLYLSDSEESFQPWAKHRDEYQFIDNLPWPPHNKPKIGAPYTTEELLEYHKLLVGSLGSRIARVDLSTASGFGWLAFDKCELQFYNIRHIQHHAGQLSERLRAAGGLEIDWVAKDA